MYSRLVKSDQDIVGCTAYALYKSAKIAYIKRTEEETGVAISELKLQAYDKTQQTSQQIQLYIDKAKSLISALNQATLDKVITQIENECSSRHNEMIKAAIATSNQPFMYGVAQSVMGAGIYSILLGIVAFILLHIKPDVVKTVIGLFG